VDADELADELYALPPEQFTAAPNTRAKEAKAAGEKETAARIAALRKPTVLAWLANPLYALGLPRWRASSLGIPFVRDMTAPGSR
jgi:hypothetical protein